MKNRSLFIVVLLGMLLSVSIASAKRTTFVSYDFQKGDATTNGWTNNAVAGSGAIEDGMCIYYLSGGDAEITTPDFEDNAFQLVQFDTVSVSLVHVGSATKIQLILNKEDDTKVVMEKSLQSDEALTQVIGFKASDKISGELSGLVISATIRIIGTASDDILGVVNLNFVSKWANPVFDASMEKMTLPMRDYDEGGKNVSYYCKWETLAPIYRKNDYVNLVEVGGGFGICIDAQHINWECPKGTSVEEWYHQWYEYTIDFKDDFEGDIALQYGMHDKDMYAFSWRVMPGGSWAPHYVWKYTGSVRLLVDGVPVSKNIPEPAFNDTVRLMQTSGDWGPRAKETLSKGVKISKGQHKVRFYMIVGRLFLKDLIFTPTTPQSVNSVQAEKSFTVYPNPVQTVLNLTSGVDSEYIVVDLMGKTHLRGIGSQINVEALPSGIYMVSVDGVAQRFVKR